MRKNHTYVNSFSLTQINMIKEKRNENSHRSFVALVIELDKDLYGPDNHLVEVMFPNLRGSDSQRSCISSGIEQMQQPKPMDFKFVDQVIKMSNVPFLWFLIIQ